MVKILDVSYEDDLALVGEWFRIIDEDGNITVRNNKLISKRQATTMANKHDTEPKNIMGSIPWYQALVEKHGDGFPPVTQARLFAVGPPNGPFGSRVYRGVPTADNPRDTFNFKPVLFKQNVIALVMSDVKYAAEAGNAKNCAALINETFYGPTKDDLRALLLAFNNAVLEEQAKKRGEDPPPAPTNRDMPPTNIDTGLTKTQMLDLWNSHVSQNDKFIEALNKSNDVFLALAHASQKGDDRIGDTTEAVKECLSVLRENISKLEDNQEQRKALQQRAEENNARIKALQQNHDKFSKSFMHKLLPPSPEAVNKARQVPQVPIPEEEIDGPPSDNEEEEDDADIEAALDIDEEDDDDDAEEEEVEEEEVEEDEDDAVEQEEDEEENVPPLAVANIPAPAPGRRMTAEQKRIARALAKRAMTPVAGNATTGRAATGNATTGRAATARRRTGLVQPDQAAFDHQGAAPEPPTPLRRSTRRRRQVNPNL